MGNNVKALCLALLLLVPVFAWSAESNVSAVIQGGVTMPDDDQWKTFYGDDNYSHAGMTLGWRVMRFFEAGLGIIYASDSGVGQFSVSGQAGGKVLLETYPTTLYGLVRLQFTETQWLVPYLGIGYDKVYYKLAIQDQERRKGSLEGTHVRFGLQLLMDNIDKNAAAGLHDFGIEHVYFVLESTQREAKDDGAGVDLGGTLYSAGFLFQF